VQKFKYLGHILCQNLSDDSDIMREVKNMFYRTNVLIRKFAKCSLHVKLTLFRAYCINLYDTALWKRFSTATYTKLKYCYHRCIKLFFGYSRSYSVTNILLELGLPSFNTLMVNSQITFDSSNMRCRNSISHAIRELGY